MDLKQLPPPLTPPECDVRSHDWFALKFRQVRDSEFWLNASDRVRVVSLHLWGCAYEQVPAASLPDRDDRLAELAGYGMFGLSQWREIRNEVLAAWIKCSDGRWYHPTLAEVALEAWSIRLKERQRKTGAAGARAGEQMKVCSEYLQRLKIFRGRYAEPEPISAEGGQKSAEALRASAENRLLSVMTRQDKGREDRKKEREALPAPRNRRSSLPDDRPTDSDLKMALEYWTQHERADIDAGKQAELFRAHHAGKGTIAADWSATWRTWYVRALEYARPATKAGGSGRSIFEDFGR